MSNNLKEYIRALAQDWDVGDTSRAQRQATVLERQIPADSTHPSAIEARRYTALARAAKTDLQGAMHIQDATAHWKDYMLFDDAVIGAKHGKEQAVRRIGKTKLNDSQKRQVVREYEAAVVKYGTIKSLARKFDVSDETISRIVKVKPIQKATIRD